MDLKYINCRQVEQPREQRFSPYENNGGYANVALIEIPLLCISNACAFPRTCLAVAGDDYCIVAADSRLSVGYSILSRTTPKISPLTQKCVVASSGCNSDQV
jgi:hypothetical protein